MFHMIKKFIKEDDQYFITCKNNIYIKNSKMLTKGSIFYAFVLCFYTIFTIVANQPEILTRMYYVFDIIHFCLCLAIFTSRKVKKNRQIITQIYCICLEISGLGFFVLEGVFADKTEHSLYIPIAILLVLLLFIHKVAYAYTITFIYVVGFALLSYLFKTTQASINDIYIAIATFISACIGYVLIAQMRHSEGNALVKYEKLSQTDQLTGLYNKTAIFKICEEMLLDYNKECPFIIIDLDNFKSVNDRYGHYVGDEVLKAVSRELEYNFRKTDFLARFGGDEFIVLMDNCNDSLILKERVEGLIASISNLSFSISELKVRCSAGITFKHEDDTIHTIFNRADMALYQAKNDGKGKYRIIK